MSKTPEISVVICTLNRVSLLKQAIRSLRKQTLSPDAFEIIVVDNGSTDGTGDSIRNMQKTYPNPRIRLVTEPVGGLGFARNRGVKEALGQYVAFLDDDAQAEAHWLARAMRCFDRITPSPLAVGGPIYPLYQGEKPAWFKDMYESDSKGNRERYLKKGETMSGSNMVMRKDTIIAFGCFPTDVGMKGTNISVGEETRLFEKIWRTVREENIFYYAPGLVVYHMVFDYKLRVIYRLKRYMVSGEAWYLRNKTDSRLHNIFLGVQSIGAFIVYSFLAIARAVGYRNVRQWIVEQLEIPVTCIGAFAAGIGIVFSVKQE